MKFARKNKMDDHVFCLVDEGNVLYSNKKCSLKEVRSQYILTEKWARKEIRQNGTFSWKHDRAE